MINFIIIFAISILSIVEVTALSYAFIALFTIIQGPPFVPTTDERLINSVKLADIQPNTKAVDLGCGDGKVLIYLAKLGCQARGFEINPLLVWLTRINIKKAGLEKKAFVHHGNFWKVDLSNFDLVYVYGINYVMKKLAVKLKKELKPGAQVISIVCPLPGWQAQKTYGKIYYYVQKLNT